MYSIFLTYFFVYNDTLLIIINQAIIISLYAQIHIFFLAKCNNINNTLTKGVCLLRQALHLGILSLRWFLVLWMRPVRLVISYKVGAHLRKDLIFRFHKSHLTNLFVFNSSICYCWYYILNDIYVSICIYKYTYTFYTYFNVCISVYL